MQDKQQSPEYTGLFDDIDKLKELLEQSKKYYSLTPAQLMQGDLDKLKGKV